MTESNFDQLKQQLLSRMVSGEITRDEYNDMLAEIESHESSVKAAGTSGGAEQDTNLPSPFPAPHVSTGDLPTGKAAISPLSEGDRLGSFRLTKKLGRGGMGEVWQARDTVGERHVVIKVLPPELAASQDEMIRIKSSFQRVHDLSHESICPTHALGHDERIGYYLVMKYIDGGTLSWYRRAYSRKYGDFPLEETLRVLKQVAYALDYAHRHKVVHRDIKPENIMVGRKGREVYVVDFGLAADIRTSLARVSQVQMDTAGTYPYMAPEQWRAQFQDARTDQYALAVVAYELLSGHLPFSSPDTSILMRAALNEPVPPISDQPDHVNQALIKAMAKERDERFASCCEFLEAMETPIDQQEVADETHEVTSAESTAPPPVAQTTEQVETKPAELQPEIQTPPSSPPRTPRAAESEAVAPDSKLMIAVICCFILSLGAAIIAIAVVAVNPRDDEMAAGFLIAGGALLLITGMIGLVWLYHAWRAVPPEYRTTTPGKAIAFLFIPLFNVYWIFRAVPAVTSALNRAAQQRGPNLASIAAYRFGVAACIFTVIPPGYVLSPFLFLVWLILTNSLKNRVLRPETAKSQSVNVDATGVIAAVEAVAVEQPLERTSDVEPLRREAPTSGERLSRSSTDIKSRVRQQRLVSRLLDLLHTHEVLAACREPWRLIPVCVLISGLTFIFLLVVLHFLNFWLVVPVWVLLSAGAGFGLFVLRQRLADMTRQRIVTLSQEIAGEHTSEIDGVGGAQALQQRQVVQDALQVFVKEYELVNHCVGGKRLAAGWCAICLGPLAIHKLILRRGAAATIMLSVTSGLASFVLIFARGFFGLYTSIILLGVVMYTISCIEGIKLLKTNDEEFFEKYIVGAREWF